MSAQAAQLRFPDPRTIVDLDEYTSPLLRKLSDAYAERYEAKERHRRSLPPKSAPSLEAIAHLEAHLDACIQEETRRRI